MGSFAVSHAPVSQTGYAFSIQVLEFYEQVVGLKIQVAQPSLLRKIEHENEQHGIKRWEILSGALGTTDSRKQKQRVTLVFIFLVFVAGCRL